MRKLQGPSKKNSHTQHRLPIKLSRTLDAADNRGETFTGNIFCGNPAMITGLACAEYLQEMRMAERHYRLHGVDELLHLRVILAKIRRQHLERDRRLAARIARMKDVSRFAACQRRRDGVVRKGGAVS